MRMWLTAVLLSFAVAGAARAGLEICNQTDELQSIAIGFKGETDWTSQGWWNIPPGDCAVLIGGALTKRYYYYYADSAGGGFRGQDFTFCTRNDEFSVTGDTDCESRGYTKTGFREIDTGESATSFTLSLVETSTVPVLDGTGAKGPGGGTPTTGEVATQTVTETPLEQDISLENDALTTQLPPGGTGKPFQVTALFQGCELEDGRAYCGFHSGGMKLRAYYKGPTDKDLLYALEDMPINTPVTVAGDQVEPDRLQVAVVLRAVTPIEAGDPLADLRRALQGDWAAANDSRSVITIRGSEIYVRYDGAYRTTRFMDLAARCSGLRGAGPVLIQTTPSDRTSECFRIEMPDQRSLGLAPVDGGTMLRFRRLR